jgi:hypothetical protein
MPMITIMEAGRTGEYINTKNFALKLDKKIKG